MTWEATVVRARAPHAVARAVAATTVVVTGAAGAHTWAGGDVPTGAGLAFVTAAVLVGSLLVFAHDVPAWALLPGVALAQLGLHESFGLASGHDHMQMGAGRAWTWPMVLAHLFVAALTAALWWAGRRATSYAVSLREHPAGPVVARRRLLGSPSPVRGSLVHLLSSPRRGPPPAVLPT